LSYTDRNWIGKGVSTPTQTAWAVLVLIECHKARIEIEDCLTRAVGFILNTFNSKGKCWTDPSSVGTGHRQLLYMQYPVYSLAWPLIALGRYKQLKSER
jgi:squalene-hopene/tetraprenyl-beta-curcumene cyclase